MSNIVGGHGSVEGEASVSVGGRVANLEAPVVGRDLDGVSGGTTTVTGNLGRPVRGSHDFEAGARKVGDLTFVFICYVMLFIVGICNSTNYCAMLATIVIIH